MRFLQYLVSPKKRTSAFEQYGGAHANCWIKVKEKAKAEQKARALIAESEWKIDSLEDEHPVSRDWYSASSEGLQYFEQALVDGGVVVFYTWPKNAN